MIYKYSKNFLRIIIAFIFILFLQRCSMDFILPKGEIAIKQFYLIKISLIMMLFIVIPVIAMIFFFVWKYQNISIQNKYKPNWDKSNLIEFFIWFFPILIISMMGYLSYKSVYELDPSKTLLSHVKPVKIEVVSLDWKWLFIYPEENIATINEIAIPVNTPLEFTITSHSVMNSFFIPSLGSQIYAMPGMISKLNLVANFSGIYKGISSNYSGKGFSGMKFSVIATSDCKSFHNWINKVKNSVKTINNLNQFKLLSIQSENNPVEYFSSIDSNIFTKIVNNSL